MPNGFRMELGMNLSDPGSRRRTAPERRAPQSAPARRWDLLYGLLLITECYSMKLQRKPFQIRSKRDQTPFQRLSHDFRKI